MRLTIFICLLCHRYPWSYSTPLRMGGQWGHRRLYFCKVSSIPFLISSPYTCILFTSINVKSNCYPIRPITSKFPPMMWWEHRRGYQQVNSAYSPFPGVWQCGDAQQNLIEKSYLYHPQSRWVLASASLEEARTPALWSIFRRSPADSPADRRLDQSARLGKGRLSSRSGYVMTCVRYRC